MITDVLYFVRLLNIMVGLAALSLVLFRLPQSRMFDYRRTARYWAYAIALFVGAEGSLESLIQGAPTGSRTALTLAFLSFALYSEWPRKKAQQHR